MNGREVRENDLIMFGLLFSKRGYSIKKWNGKQKKGENEMALVYF